MDPLGTPVRSPPTGGFAGGENRGATLPSYLFPGATPTASSGSNLGLGGWAPAGGGMRLTVPGSPLAVRNEREPAPTAAVGPAYAPQQQPAGGGGGGGLMAPPVGDLYELLAQPSGATGAERLLASPTAGPAGAPLSGQWEQWGAGGGADSASGELGRWVVAFGFGAGAAAAVLRALAAAGDVSAHRPGAGNFLYVQFASPLAAAAAAARPVRLLPGGLLVGVLPAASAPVPPPPVAQAASSGPAGGGSSSGRAVALAPHAADPLSAQGRGPPPPAAASSLPARVLEYLFAL